MDTSEPILRARQVTKVFGSDVVAIDRVDLEVAAGHWLAITGSSGSGKTTLLQLFAALDTPTSGQVLFEGVDLRALHDLDRYRRNSIGIVFQLHNLLPHLSVRDNIEVAMLGGRLNRRERTSRVSQLVHETGLDEQQLRRPPELSGGSAKGRLSPEPWPTRPKCYWRTNRPGASTPTT